MGKMNESGKRLKKAREAKHLTLRGLSKLTNGVLSPSRLSNYEQGLRQMGTDEVLALYKHLSVSPAYLLCVDVEGDMTRQEEELLRAFRALPERDRNDYSRRIEVLAMAYREPVPDERLNDTWRSPAKAKKTRT